MMTELEVTFTLYDACRRFALHT